MATALQSADLEVGDAVYYAPFGVARIKDISHKDSLGVVYTLTNERNSGTVSVPAARKHLLQPIDEFAGNNALARALKIIAAPPAPQKNSTRTWQAKMAKLKKRLEAGTFDDLVIIMQKLKCPVEKKLVHAEVEVMRKVKDRVMETLAWTHAGHPSSLVEQFDTYFIEQGCHPLSVY